MFRLCWSALSLAWRALRALLRLPQEAARALGTPAGGPASRRTRLWIALLVSLPACLLAAIVLPKLTLVMSPSIDAWLVTRAPGPIRKGDLVQFILSHPAAAPAPVSATKYALCMPGETVRIVEQSVPTSGAAQARFYCGTALLGVSLSRGRRGMKLDYARIAGIIPSGFVYVGSTHPHGFDSRYIGLVAIDRLQRMRPIL
jgi:conjugal transfer pilin signal peptidase TrbI